VADEGDPSLEVVRMLVEKYGRKEGREGGVEVRVVVGQSIPLGLAGRQMRSGW
jgi:hypothetical protein